jgi:hypothetical protein
MVRYSTSSLLGASLFLLVGCNVPDSTTSAEEGDSRDAAVATRSQAMPSGSHYSLNLIGMPKGKTADMTGNNGHRIFVNLAGKTRILLGEGEFQVLDANGTDGSASFQLPDPDPENDGVTAYSVWARALGKPGGKAGMVTAATDPTTGETVYSLETTVFLRSSGKSSFADVSKYLLYVYADLDGDGTAERYPLFDEALQDYFWEYDNNGLKLLQMRFYPVASDVNTAGSDML